MCGAVWYTSRMILLHLAIMAALSLVMGKAARHIADAVRVIAKGFGVSDFFISFGLLGLATSMPEISVAVFSAMRGTPALSLGNLLGANVVVLSLLCGLAAIMARKLNPTDIQRHHTLPMFLANVSLPILAVADGRLTRVDGLFLTIAHLVFLGHEYRGRRWSLAEWWNGGSKDGMGRHAAVAAVAVTTLLIASYFLVNSALVVASALGAAPIVIGLLMFSIGTNLPELALVLTQSRTHRDVVAGDLFGNVLLNTPTLGLLALISPFEIEQKAAVFVSCAFLAIVIVCFGVFMRTKRELARWEGYVLVGLYAAYLAYYARFL